VTEIGRYYRSLEALATRDSPDASIVIAKFGELKGMIDVCAFPCVFDDREQIEDRPSSYFTQINNQLRSLAEMMNLGAFAGEIADFITGLPTDHFHSNVASFSWGSAANRVGFEGVAILTGSYEKEPIKLRQVFLDPAVRNGVLFALFSGRTVALKAPNDDAAFSFARRLSALSPFKERFSIGQVGEMAVQRHAIVVAHGPVANADLLELGAERTVFRGQQCPLDSIVTKVFAHGKDDTENRLILSISNDAKRIYGRFRFKIAELCGRAVDTEEAVVRGLRAEGFGAGDVPIFRFWAFNLRETGARPILIDRLS
jgi:hypothetical protein